MILNDTIEDVNPKVVHSQPLRAFLFAELIASYHQLSPFSQVKV